MTAAIGAVVVSHQSAADLPTCLRALLAADIDRILVVDNASTDESSEIATRLAGAGIELLALERNTGFAGGCNRGFAALAGDCEAIAVLNPDVRVQPSCLRLAADVVTADDGPAAVAPRLMRPDGLTVDSVGQVLHPLTLEVRDRGYGRPISAELMRRRPVLAPCGALAVFRRDALAAVATADGPWAEPFFCFWEDLELGWRLVNAGYRVEALPHAVAVHGRGAGAAAGSGPLRWRRPVELEACVVSNRWMTLTRHLHGLDLAVRLPLLLSWDLALVALGAIRRPALVPAIARRWPLVVQEWRSRGGRSRRRLAELPW